jgi:hypothetical protein
MREPYDPLTLRDGVLLAPARAESGAVIGDGLRAIDPGSDEWARWRAYVERVAPDAPSLQFMRRIDAR